VEALESLLGDRVRQLELRGLRLRGPRAAAVAAVPARWGGGGGGGGPSVELEPMSTDRRATRGKPLGVTAEARRGWHLSGGVHPWVAGGTAGPSGRASADPKNIMFPYNVVLISKFGKGLCW